jgi:predicted AlkP superfamily phosphohydrolase/phosphomutase
LTSCPIVLTLLGAPVDLNEPWTRDGRLLHLGDVVDTQVRGRLQSTIPPMMAVAWSAHATGLDAGKRGLFDSIRRWAQGYDWGLIRSGDGCVPRWMTDKGLGWRC